MQQIGYSWNGEGLAVRFPKGFSREKSKVRAKRNIKQEEHAIMHPQGSYTNTTPDGRVNHYQIKVRMP